MWILGWLVPLMLRPSLLLGHQLADLHWQVSAPAGWPKVCGRLQHHDWWFLYMRLARYQRQLISWRMSDRFRKDHQSSGSCITHLVWTLDNGSASFSNAVFGCEEVLSRCSAALSNCCSCWSERYASSISCTTETWVSMFTLWKVDESYRLPLC